MKKFGFSLMEMMIVLAIVSVVLAASAPMINQKLTTTEAQDPWVFTNAQNAIAFNLAGDENMPAVIGTTTRPVNNIVAGSRLHIAIDDGQGPSISFSRGNPPTLMGLTVDGNSIYFTNQNVRPWTGDGCVVMGNTARKTVNNIANVIAIGNNARVGANRGVAIGSGPQATALNAIAIGGNSNTTATNVSAVAIGHDADATGQSSISIGNLSSAGNLNAIAIGTDTSANNVGAIAAGLESRATGIRSIAIGSALDGNNTQATDLHAIAIGGNGTTATGSESIAIGANADAVAGNAISIGTLSTASGLASTALGNNTRATESTATALGNGARATASNTIALGNGAQATVNSAVAIGRSTEAIGSQAYAIGDDAHATQERAIAIGATARANGIQAIAIGTDARATANQAIAIGSRVVNNTPNTIMLGRVGLPVVIPGDLTVSGTIHNGIFSDRRLKDVGEVFTGGLEEIKKLELFNFTFKKDKEKTPQVGVMAQDLQKVFPNSVREGEDGFLRIRWDEMFYAVINAIKELDFRLVKLEIKQSEMDKLIEVNKELKNQNKELKKELDKSTKEIKRVQEKLEEIEKMIKKMK